MGSTGIIDRTKVEDAYRGFKGNFDMALEAAQTDITPLAMTVTSEGSEELYNWFGPVPKMKEWIGDRQVDELRAYSQTIVNKDWANGIRINANDIADDKLGMIAPRIASLAQMAAQHQYEMLIDLLISGFTTTCYDGQYFFDTDHVDGNGSAQSNKGTTALAADGVAYNAAIQALMSIQDEKGTYLRIQPTHLIVGPKLRSIALALVEADTVSTGGANVNFGTTKLIVEPKLNGTYDDYWFVIAGGGPVKPLVLQQREAVQFIAQDDPSSEGYFNRKEFRYGANWRGNVGFGLWQLAFGAIV